MDEPLPTPAPEPATPPPTPQTPEDEARARARACYGELEAVLRRHRCTIIPSIAQPEQVGDTGLLLRATYSIVPLP